MPHPFVPFLKRREIELLFFDELFVIKDINILFFIQP